ncbi:MAG: thymidylate kinase [Oligoflexia bacterium]|nr:thymidylate kinase [Oligoflexia bacterium]
MTTKHYGKCLPRQAAGSLKGRLIVIEGADGAGRSTQVRLLRDSLERVGYPTIEVGLKRSALVGEELESAMQGNVLGPTTMSLFYATDFADQLENTIYPALRAGFVVVADRYIYTLMARDVVRGARREWVQDVYQIALVPDMIFYLDVPPRVSLERSLQKQGELDYWESGMDIQRSGDRFECFMGYQSKIKREFHLMKSRYGFRVINGTGEPMDIHFQIMEHLQPELKAAPQRPTAMRRAAKSSKRAI